MNTERELILRIARSMPPTTKHINDVFHSDSEIIDIGGSRYLFTIDSYTDEDHFRTDDPYLLGRNLCVCTISDILASGGTLLFFAHSVTVPENWDIEYVGMLSDGISDVIKSCQGFFAGGDLGSSSHWNFTGVAFGEAERIVTRKGARPGDLVYVSGPVGAGNFEAAFHFCGGNPELSELFDNHRVEFPLRIAESKLMSEYASACIDTSDGLLNALITLADINAIGFAVTSVPYYPPGVTLTDLLGLPVELLMAGECGEYELLFTVPPEREQDMVREAQNHQIQLYHIGRMTEPGNAMVMSANQSIDVRDFDVSARNYRDHREYVAMLTEYLTNKKQPGR
jgi:thiamine-monophosphate kinase